MADWAFSAAGHLLPLEIRSDSAGISRVTLRLRREVDALTPAPVNVEEGFKKAAREKLKDLPELQRWHSLRAQLTAARKRLTHFRGKMELLIQERSELRRDCPRHWAAGVLRLDLEIKPMKDEADRLAEEVRILEETAAEAKEALDGARNVLGDQSARQCYDSARADVESRMQSSASIIGAAIEPLLAALHRQEQARRLVECRRDLNGLLEEVLEQR